MNRYKICVYAICKNEEKFVDRWVDSMSEADQIVVTDTGSDDGTVEKLRNRGAVVYTDIIQPWRFDVARNVSMDHIPDDVDICVCTDLDEVFEPGWRKKLEEAWGDKEPQDGKSIIRRGKYLYNWSLKADKTPDVHFIYSKVHGRHGFRWKWPVHEYLQYEGSLPLETVFIDGMVLNHYPDASKSRGSYLPLLELAIEESPMDERMLYYLGREYMYKGEWKKCIDTLKDYLALPTAAWKEERCAAMRWIANSCLKLGQITEAYCWYYKAIAEVPHMRDPYVEFAKMCYGLQDWPMTLFLAEEALKIKEKSTTYINMGYSWDYTLDDLCAIASYRMNLTEKSFVHAREALNYAPNNERLKNNLLIIKEAIKDSELIFMDCRNPQTSGKMHEKNQSEKEMRYSTDLTDEQWAAIEPRFKAMVGNYGNRAKWSKRELTNAVLYRMKTGCPWRRLPIDFPPYNTVRTFYRRAKLNGTWKLIMDDLAKVKRLKARKSTSSTHALMDSQSV